MVIEATNMQLNDLERLVNTLQEKERAERELRRAAEEANRTKTNFLANISHEIRTPMTAILGYAELLRDPSIDPSERADYVETVRRNGDHLLAIINDILDLSKIEAGRFDIDLGDVVVPDVVRDVVRLLNVRAVSQGVTLTHVVEGDAPRIPIRSDPVRIRQVLLNIVGNAVKFTEQGGVRVVVSAVPRGKRMETTVAVHDTGCGIPPEILPSLFEPFCQSDNSYTRRHGGTGLGLAISKRLAGLLGGRIEVASEPQRGSVFTFTFESDVAGAAPTHPSEVEASPQRAAPGVLGGRHILLVEDSIDSQRILSALMSLAGARVDVASDGLSAVGRFDGTYCPDLVIMDMQMPGIDGIEATARIRARGFGGEHGLVIGVTALSRQPQAHAEAATPRCIDIERACAQLHQAVARSSVAVRVADLAALATAHHAPAQRATQKTLLNKGGHRATGCPLWQLWVAASASFCAATPSATVVLKVPPDCRVSKKCSISRR
jgi:nitrogen-specific signal transduction histidine kinase